LKSIFHFRISHYQHIFLKEQNRIEYSMIQYNGKQQNGIEQNIEGRHWVTHALWPWPILCAALELIHSAGPQFEQNAVSCWQRCLWSHLFSYNDDSGAYILMWPKPNNQKEYVRLFQMSTCIYHTKECLTTPDWIGSLLIQCLVTNLFNILSLFLLRLSNSLACWLPLSTYGLPMLLMFSTSAVLDHLHGNLCRYITCRFRSY
jgi:hypothetical protein